MNEKNINHVPLAKEITNGARSVVEKYWEYILDQIWIPLCQYCIRVSYTIYTHVTLFNLVLFLVKCIPTGVFMCRFLKNFFATCREKMKVKQLEFEEIQLQIQIVQTKLSVREAEFAERVDILRRKAENLRRVRARVREIIADDEDLRGAIDGHELWDDSSFFNSNNTSEEGKRKTCAGCARVREIVADDEDLRGAIDGHQLWDDSSFFNSNNTSEEVSSESRHIMELLRELKYDQIEIPEIDPEMLSCGEPSREPTATDTSLYSSANDPDGKQECHVKIVKVTNVYRVAYLRHFIKQKRLRRANRQALLRKKMDTIKKLLDDWQKTLSMVINSKLSLLSDSPQVELASQEAMGDCSKPVYNSSDSDSDFINSSDSFHDNYSLSWSQNQYSPVYNSYNNHYEFPGDTAVSREYYDVREYEKCNECYEEQHECNKGVLYIVPEETTSQMEIKEIDDAE